MANIYEILLVDRNRLLREGLKQMLHGSDLVVRHECVDAQEALTQSFEGWTPNIVLLAWGGVDVAKRDVVSDLLQRWPEAKVIALGNSLNKGDMIMALRSGARGFLLKDMSFDALIHSLRLALAGEVVFPSELAAYLVNEPPGVENAQLRLEQVAATLSAREIEILQCLVGGLANKSIARKLGITEGTVKVHIKRLLKKINVQNRTQAAIWALSSGIQEPRS